jgi:hypothetical protein
VAAPVLAACGSITTVYVPAVGSVSATVLPDVPKKAGESRFVPLGFLTATFADVELDVPIVTFVSLSVTRWPAEPVKAAFPF